MAVFKSLLVPIDGSEPAEAASSLAIRLAADQKASVMFVNVVESDKILAMAMPGQGYADPAPAIDALQNAGTQILADAVKEAQAAGVTAQSTLLEGDCVSSIVARAEDVKADLIVIGSHGRSGLTKLVLGSVAEGVLQHCSVPVLIVKSPTI